MENKKEGKEEPHPTEKSCCRTSGGCWTGWGSAGGLPPPAKPPAVTGIFFGSFEQPQVTCSVEPSVGPLGGGQDSPTSSESCSGEEGPGSQELRVQPRDAWHRAGDFPPSGVSWLSAEREFKRET